MKKKVDALRFAVGDEVLCKTDLTEWTRGKVVALMYGPMTVRVHVHTCRATHV